MRSQTNLIVKGKPIRIVLYGKSSSDEEIPTTSMGKSAGQRTRGIHWLSFSCFDSGGEHPSPKYSGSNLGFGAWAIGDGKKARDTPMRDVTRRDLSRGLRSQRQARLQSLGKPGNTV